jgi:hypothetical protein
MKTNRYCPLWAFPFLFLILQFGYLHAGRPCDLVLTEAVWISPNIIRIPFTLTGTLITIRARADTVEGNFFFDTGASNLLLNYRYFGKRSGRIVNQAGGVTGKVEVLGTTRIDTFLADNLRVLKLSADVIDLSHIENAKKTDVVGIIGYEVFKDFQVLFDYQSGMLLLARTDKKGELLEAIQAWEYEPTGDFPIDVEGHIAMLSLRFGPKTAKSFALDSGAEQNLLSNATGTRFLKNNFEIRKRVKLVGAGRESLELLSGVLNNARVDSIQLTPMVTLLTDLSQINSIYQTDVDGVLGYEFFVQKPFSINYKKRRLTFYKRIRP